MAPEPPAVSFEGMEFAIDDSMLRKPSAKKKLRFRLAAVAVLLLAYGAGRIQTLLILGLVIALLIIVALPILHLAFGKALSSRTASFFVPLAMAGVDAKFSKVRTALLLKTLRGRILDIGSGGGAYLKYCFAATDHPVTEVVALEPNVHCHGKLRKVIAELQRGKGLHKLPFTERRPLPRTRIESAFMEDHLAAEGSGRYDSAILGNVLCEVPHPHSLLIALDKLLVDGAIVYFSEHVRHAPGSWKAVMQDAVNPWWHTLSDGCNCNRRTLDIIRSSCPEWKLVHWTFDEMPGPFEVGLAVVRRQKKKKKKGGSC